MLKGQLYINGKDAYITWGIFLDETALSALMTPAPNKEFISNKYRSKDGKSVIKHIQSRIVLDNRLSVL